MHYFTILLFIYTIILYRNIYQITVIEFCLFIHRPNLSQCQVNMLMLLINTRYFNVRREEWNNICTATNFY